MRHAPNNSARRLLESLGVSWRIDPNAPRCERSCGEPAASNLSREELDAVRILIDERTRERDLPWIRERVEREINRGARVVREPRDVTLVRGLIEQTEAGPVFTDRECKADGCENRANAKWDRGSLSGICYEVHVPLMRERLRAAGRKRHGLNGNGDQAGIAGDGLRPSKPALPGRVRVDEVDTGETFAEVAKAVETARAALAEASTAYDRAVERFALHVAWKAIRADVAKLEEPV